MQCDDKWNTIDERFKRFHAQHPEVYQNLVYLTRFYTKNVRRTEKIGIGMLWEILRWRTSIISNTDDAFKLPNDFRSRYARLIMEQEPDLAGVFVTKRLTSA